MKKVIKFVKGKRDDDNYISKNRHIEPRKMSVEKLENMSGDDEFMFRDKSITKLHKAVWNENCDKLKSIIKTHDIDITDRLDRTALYFAVLKNNTNIINLLLDNNANQNIPDIDGITPFLKSIQLGYRLCATILLNRGADIKRTDKHSNSCLHFALMGTHVDMLEFLLKHNADSNVPNANGEYPLHIAVVSQNVKMVKMLLCHHADMNVRNASGQSPFDVAQQLADAEVVSLLNKYTFKITSNCDVLENAEPAKADAVTKSTYPDTETWNDSPIASPSPRKNNDKTLIKIAEHLFREETDVSESDVSASPQSGVIPPPCKPLRSLEYLQSVAMAMEGPVHLLTLGTVRTRHISMTESEHNTPHRYSYQGDFHLNTNAGATTTCLPEHYNVCDSSVQSDWGSDDTLPTTDAFLQKQFSILEDYERNHDKHCSVSKPNANANSRLDDINHLLVLEDNNRINAQLETYAGNSDIALVANKSKSLPRNCEPCSSYHKGSFSLPRTLESSNDVLRSYGYFKPRSRFFSLKLLKKDKSGFIDKLKNMFNNKKSQVHLTDQAGPDRNGTWLYSERSDCKHDGEVSMIPECVLTQVEGDNASVSASVSASASASARTGLNDDQNKEIEKFLSLSNMNFESGHSRKSSSSQSQSGRSNTDDDSRSRKSVKKIGSSVRFLSNDANTLLCDDCSDYLNLKLVEAEQTILSKENFIKLLQDQLTRLKHRNIESINEAQDIIYKFSIAKQELSCLKLICKKYDEELQKLRSERLLKKEYEQDAIKLKEEADKWKKQYEELYNKWRSVVASEVSAVNSLQIQNRKLEQLVERLQRDLLTSANKQQQLEQRLQPGASSECCQHVATDNTTQSSLSPSPSPPTQLSTVIRLINQLETLHINNSDMEVKIKEAELAERTDLLEKNNEALKHDLFNQTTLIQHLESNIHTLKEQTNQLLVDYQQVQHIRQQNSDLRTQIGNLLTRIEELNSALESKNSLVNENRTVVKELMHSVQENENRCQDLLLQLNVLESEVEEKANTNVLLSEQNAQLKCLVDTCKRDNGVLSVDNSQLRQKLSTQQLAYEQVSEACTQQQFTIEKLQLSNGQLQLAMEQLRGDNAIQLQMATAKCDSLLLSIDSFKFYHDNEMNAKNARYEDLKTENDKLTLVRDENALLKEKLAQAERDKTALLQNISKLQKQVEHLNFQVCHIKFDESHSAEFVESIYKENREMKSALSVLGDILEEKIGEKLCGVPDVKSEKCVRVIEKAADIIKSISQHTKIIDTSNDQEVVDTKCLKSVQTGSKSVTTSKIPVTASQKSAVQNKNDYKNMCANHTDESNATQTADTERNAVLLQRVHSIEKELDTIIKTSSSSAVKSASMPNLDKYNENIEIIIKPDRDNIEVLYACPIRSTVISKSSSVECVSVKCEEETLLATNRDLAQQVYNRQWEKHLEAVQRLRAELNDIIVKLSIERGKHIARLTTEEPPLTNHYHYHQAIDKLQRQIDELQLKSAEERHKCYGLQAEVQGLKTQIQLKTDLQKEIINLRTELHKQQTDRLQQIQVAKIRKEAEIISIRQKLKDDYVRSKQKLLSDLATVQSALQAKHEEEIKLKKKCEQLVREVAHSQEARKQKLLDISSRSPVPAPAPASNELSGCSYQQPQTDTHTLQPNVIRAELTSVIQRHRLNTDHVHVPVVCPSDSEQELHNKYLLK